MGSFTFIATYQSVSILLFAPTFACSSPPDEV